LISQSRRNNLPFTVLCMASLVTMTHSLRDRSALPPGDRGHR